MWMQMNARARHEQFLSNEFPKGEQRSANYASALLTLQPLSDFTFQSINNLLYRIFILGYSSTTTKLVPCRVYIAYFDFPTFNQLQQKYGFRDVIRSRAFLTATFKTRSFLNASICSCFLLYNPAVITFQIFAISIMCDSYNSIHNRGT